MLTDMYDNQKELRDAYKNVPGIISEYVETIFGDVQKIQKTGKKMMDMTEIAYHDYPKRMMPLVRHHYSDTSNFFNSENVTHYLRVIMFGCYNHLPQLADYCLRLPLYFSKRVYLFSMHVLFSTRIPPCSSVDFYDCPFISD
jgi:hypothetical protein